MLHKSRIYPVVLIIIMILVWWYRNKDDQELMTTLGETMGTTYSIKFLSNQKNNLKTELDSILILFNNSLSTYKTDSEISTFNKDSTFTFDLPFFLPVLKASREVYLASEGAFDPTVMPLVRAWGFGPGSSSLPDSTQVDSLLQFVGFEKVSFNNEAISKRKKGVELDFSAIAKGYGVDVISVFLESEEIENYLVEIGGELRAKGNNAKGESWRVGIDDPTFETDSREIKAVIGLKNRAMATSGNYRNFFIKDGVKYAHTIDPRTGYPVQHSLLSASVFAKDCMTADAWATAFMVHGLDSAIILAKSNPGLDAFFIYDDGSGALKTYATEELGMIEVLN